MKPLKYVIFKKGAATIPILTPKDVPIKHSEIKVSDGTAQSAGFVIIDIIQRRVSVYGESVSLDLKSKDSDKEIIERELFHYL